MIVSTRGRYALRVMIDLTQHKEEGYIPLKTIAQRQGISEKYLEAILKTLVKNELLQGIRGKGGGYRLKRDPADYTVWDVISLTEEGLNAVSCLGSNAETCPQADFCATLPMWKAFDKVMAEFFSGYTIAELAEEDAKAMAKARAAVFIDDNA